MAIAFLPIEIDAKLPDEAHIIDYCHQNCLNIPNFASRWKFTPILSRLTDDEWTDLSKIEYESNHRYNVRDGEIRYANNIDKIFPEIPYMLNQLPFKKITFAAMILQKEYIPYHIDTHPGEVIDDLYEISIDNEPHRYNILLTHHNKDAFFVSETVDGKKIYPKITKNMPCYAFSERYHFHGSDYIGENKIQIIIFGIVDRIKHKDTIIKNLIKHYNNAIIFPDPSDVFDPNIISNYNGKDTTNEN
jgi:hypothetical protein